MDWSGPSSGLIRRLQAGSIPAPAIEVNVAEDLDNVIRENAAGPAKASDDGTSVEQHSLADQIAADKYLLQKAAGRNPAKALTRVKIVPPGAV